MVFMTRYLDLFTTFYSIYNSCIKLGHSRAIAESLAGARFHTISEQKLDQDEANATTHCL